MPDDSPTRLKGTATPGKRVAWGEPLPLDEVKAVGKVLEASINDVLLVCVAGAIGDYLRSKGDDPTAQEIRAMVPVNLRPLERGLQARQPLRPGAAGVADRHRQPDRAPGRGARAHGRTEGQLSSRCWRLACWRLSGLVVKPVQSRLTDLFAKKATAVMTNVPGPAASR